MPGGERGLLAVWIPTSALGLANPLQAIQMVRQVVGNLRLAAAESRSGDDGRSRGQRFALDLVRADADRRRHRGRGTRLQDYFCHGEPIVAAADGVVVEARDGIRPAPFVGWGVCDFLAGRPGQPVPRCSSTTRAGILRGEDAIAMTEDRHRQRTIVFLLIGLVLSCAAPAPRTTVAGFRTHDGYDHGRSYRAGRAPGGRSGPAASRPMQVGIWYPASGGDGESLTLREYTRLAARADDPDAAGREAADAVIRALEISPELDPGRLNAVLNRPTRAVRGARPVDGTHPVLLMAMGSGAPWYNNYRLAETLARRGYVVLASRSAAARHPYMSLDEEGAETGASDLEYLAALAHTLPFADPSRLGVIGRSWGAVPAVIFAARNGSARAIVSLDGTISYNASSLAAERVTSPYDGGEAVRTPIFVAVGANRPAGATPIDRVTYFEDVTHADAYHATYHEMRHGDFASRFLDLKEASVAPRAEEDRADAGYAAMLEDVGRFLDHYVARVGEGPVAYQDDVIRAIAFDPAGPERPEAFAFDRAAFDLGADAAISMFRRVSAEDPEHRMFGWYSLHTLGNLMIERGSYADALAIARFASERYPDRVAFLTLQGRALVAAGDTGVARAVLERVLAFDSTQSDARQLLRRLTGEAR